MKKFFKVFFSRMVVIGLYIVLQFLLIFFGFRFLDEKFPIFNLIFSIIGLIFVLIILSKDEPSSFKVPWLILTLLLPLFGILTLLTFGNFSWSRSKKKKINNKITENSNGELNDNIILNKLEEVDPIVRSQAAFVKNSSNSSIYDSCYSEYYKIGQDFFESLKNELKKAEHFILMEYFIVDYGHFIDDIIEILEAKAKEGVKVYFMYDDIGSIAKVKNNFDKMLRKKGINAYKFNKFYPIISVAHNNRDHRKITVIDGKVGFVGGINLADEYINEKEVFGIWKDSALMVKGLAVNDLARTFLSLYVLANKNLSKEEFDDILNARYEYERQEDEKDLGIVIPYHDGPRPLYMEYIACNIYLTMINQAKYTCYVTTPYLIVDNDMIQAFINAAKRNVDVRIILPGIPDKKLVNNMTKTNYKKLIANGVKVYEYSGGFIHAKNVLIDGKIASCGTVNFDYRSLVHHFENGIWMYNTKAVKEMEQDFVDMFDNEVVQIGVDNYKRTFKETLLKILMALVGPMM